jgi:predicted Zn-ribbon and HTH transcriptional regulator
MKKTKTLQRNDKVEVIWKDIVSASQWLNEEQRKGVHPASCKTMGYFFDEDDECIRISPTINEFDGDGDIIAIVKGCIVEIGRFK